MPVCLHFGSDYNKFEFGYVAGFGSTNFATNCWTTNRGPNPYEQCRPQFKFKDKVYTVGRVPFPERRKNKCRCYNFRFFCQKSCVKDQEPPHGNPLCRVLYSNDRGKLLPMTHRSRIHILNKKTGKKEFCPHPGIQGKDGWCEILPPVMGA